MKVRKINLDLQNPISITNKSPLTMNGFKEVSSKRLKYCFRRKQMIPSTDTNHLSNQFCDHQYFSAPKSSINVIPLNNTSNLLTKSKIEPPIK